MTAALRWSPQWLVGALLLGTCLGACADDETGDGPAASSSTTVVVTDDSLTLMYRSVIRSVCEAATSPALDCDGAMSVSEQFSGNGMTTTETLPPFVVEAAHAELPGVTFIDPEGSLETPFIVLGPAEMPLPGVVAIDAGHICGNLCGQGTIYYFQYDADGWEAVTADDLGLPTEIWMS